MKNISDIDKHFKVKTPDKKDDMKYFSALENPFKIYGVYYEDGKFRRLPETPVIMMTSPSILKNRAVADRRKEIIRTTYLNALNSGDKNVYYLDGEEIMAPCGLDGTVEGIHPNDIGFYFMAKAVGDLIEKIL